MNECKHLGSLVPLRAAVRLCGVLLFRHRVCCELSRTSSTRGDHTSRHHAALIWAMLVAATGVVLAGEVKAQEAAAPAKPDVAFKLPAEKPILDWSDARKAQRQAEAWVRAGKVSQGNPQPVAGVSAVSVTLRWGRLTMGTGQAAVPAEVLTRWTSEAAPPAVQQVIDLEALTAAATREALESLRQRLRDREDRAVQQSAPSQDQAARGSYTLENVVPLLQVDVQFARTPEPVVMQVRDPQEKLLLSFASGYHGLHARQVQAGQLTQAWVWPAFAIATNASPQQQLQLVLKQLGLDSKSMEQLGRPAPAGISLWRFEVIHAVQPTRKLSVMPLIRGQVVLPPTALSQADLESMAQRLADHLRKRQNQDGTLAGTYHPTADRWDPPQAETRDVALAAYAMAKRANRIAATDPDAMMVLHARQFVRQAMAAVMPAMAGSRAAAADPAAVSLVLMTLLESPQLAEFKNERDRLAQVLLAMRDEQGHWKRPQPLKPGDVAPKESSATPSLPVQVLMTCALSQQFEQNRSPELAQAIHVLRDQLWQEPNLTANAGVMPWLAMLEIRMARTAVPPQTAQTNPQQVQRFEALRQLALALRQSQLTTKPADGPDDVIGAYMLQKQPAGTVPNPTWLCGNVLAFESLALRYPELAAGQNTLKWLIDCGLGARFLAQLMMDEPTCFYLEDSTQVLGAVRLTLWDNRLAVAPTAMALLAVNELQTSLEAR